MELQAGFACSQPGWIEPAIPTMREMARVITEALARAVADALRMPAGDGASRRVG